MSAAKNYYQVLNINPHASRDLVRAAYRSLSQKHHPDRNPSPMAQHRMSEINEAYTVLYHPEKRAKYDLMLAGAKARQKFKQYRQSQPQQPKDVQTKAQTHQRRIPIGFYALCLVLMSIASISSYLLYKQPVKTEAGPKLSQPPLIAIKPGYQPSSSAENGEAWPENSAYIRGYPVFNDKGQALVRLLNHNQHGNIAARLIHIYADERYAVRVFYLKAGTGLDLQGLTPGRYQLTFQDLYSGYTGSSEEFKLAETSELAIKLGRGRDSHPLAIISP